MATTSFYNRLRGHYAKVDSYSAGITNDGIYGITVASGPSAGLYERINKGSVNAEEAGILYDGTDQTAKLNAVLAIIPEIHFNNTKLTNITISGTVIATGKKLVFSNGNKLIGTGTLTGGIIEAPPHYQIFATTLTVNPERVPANEFCVDWYIDPAVLGSDCSLGIQKSIDVVIRNESNYNTVRFGCKVYTINKPIIVCNFSTGANHYQQVTLKIRGAAQLFNDNSSGTIINVTHKNSFAIGWQLAKNLLIEGLHIRGQFAVPALYANTDEFFKSNFEDFTDPTCRDTSYSPYAGLVLDPFSNSAASIPADGGYPGNDAYGVALSTYYRGSGGSGGSTGTHVLNCFIEQFTVGFCSSPNTFTRNSELTIIERTQFQTMKLAISASHDQEKGNEVKVCNSWFYVHTFFAGNRYGAGVAGQWRLHNISLAGNVNTLVEYQSGGRYPIVLSFIFAESLGRFGKITSLVGGIVENSNIEFASFDFAELNTITACEIETIGIIFDNCNLRRYGSRYPLTLKGNPVFENCTFEDVPVTLGTDIANYINCSANSGRLGATGIVSGIDNTLLHSAYGNYVIQSRGLSGLITNWEFDNAGLPRVNLYVVPSTIAMALVAGNKINLTVDPTRSNYLIVDKPVYYDNGILGIVESVNTSTGVMVIKYVAKNFIAGNYSLYTSHPIIFNAPFLGTLTGGSNIISNLKADAAQAYGLSVNVGKVFKSESHAIDTYEGVMFISGYNSGAATYTTTTASFYTNDVYFSNSKRKRITPNSANTHPEGTNVMAGRGSIITNTGGGFGFAEYITKKDGYFDSAAAFDARQMEYAPIIPLKEYTNADVGFTSPPGCLFETIIFIPVVDSILRLGTGVGLDDIMPDTAVLANQSLTFRMDIYKAPVIYVSGIVNRTDVIRTYK